MTATAAQTQVPAPLFRAENLTIAYPGSDQPTIDRFSLDIRAGQIVSFLGRSGCGKTTLLKALAGLVVGENSGGVLFKGRYLDGPNPESVMIFQENNLFPWLSVAGNVGFGLRFKGGRGERRQRVADMLATVDLSDAARQYPHQLSGGMRQRAAIARALVVDPTVLLLDEPFSALDVGLRRRMHELMHRLWERTRKSMLMVTHNVEEAIFVSHRVVVLGNQPAEVLLDVATDDAQYKDRYSQPFLELQQRIETLIYEPEAT